MMLIVLSDNPVKSTFLLPKKIKHTQLKELMQMLSCVVDFGYKQIPQGKEIKEWITKNKLWVYYYASHLLTQLKSSLKEETIIKYQCIIDLLYLSIQRFEDYKPTTAILRYKEGYECKYPTNTELPIEECIKIYEDYAKWKGWE